MSDFKVIETQEQLDEIIKDRIARAEKSAAEKYADYNELKTANDEKDKQIAELSAQLKEQGEKSTEYDTKITELNNKIHGYELAAVKTKIAHEVGIPYQLAGKLAGDTEDDIRQDAKLMAKLMVQPATAPIGSNEPSNEAKDPTDAALLNMLNQIKE